MGESVTKRHTEGLLRARKLTNQFKKDFDDHIYHIKQSYELKFQCYDNCLSQARSYTSATPSPIFPNEITNEG